MPTLATVLSRGRAKDAILAGLLVEEQLEWSAADTCTRRLVFTPELRAGIETFLADIAWHAQEEEGAGRGLEFWERDHGIGRWREAE